MSKEQPNLDDYELIPKDQNDNIIKQKLYLSKDFSHVYQNRGDLWHRCKVSADNRFRFHQNEKEMRMSITQAKKILQEIKNMEKPKDETLILCEKFRSYKICNPKLYRQVRLIQEKPFPFTYFNYFQDQGKGLIQINQKDKKLKIEQIKSDNPIIIDTIIQGDPMMEYLYNELEIEPINIFISQNKKMTVLLKDLDIEYNLIPQDKFNIDGLFNISSNCCIIDSQLNKISFHKRPLFHDITWHHWYQQMENGWYHVYYENEILNGIIILDDNCCWKETNMDIEHWKYNFIEKEVKYDDEKETWHIIKTDDPKNFFDEKQWVEITQYKNVQILPYMIYYELPNECEKDGRFITQCKRKKNNKYDVLYYHYKQLPIVKGKVDCFIDYNYSKRVLIDVKEFFEIIMPQMFPEIVNKLKELGTYPNYEEELYDEEEDVKKPTKEMIYDANIWKEEEEELEMDYRGCKPSLFNHPKRPRALTLERLIKQEKFLKATDEEKNKMLHDESLWLMKQFKKLKK
ncbi:MAG: hypothetical protein LBR15_00650 [Methanobrevibacter sp.]|jgi:hypothetical protein|nr:hypothetical protein [Candidatus Methanovirga australis]